MAKFMDKPLVSVVVIFEPDAELADIKNTIGKLEKQSYSNLEILPVVSRTYTDLDIRHITYDETETPFIKGLTHCKGEYVCCLGGDCHYTVHAIYSLIDKALAADSDLTMCPLAVKKGNEICYYNNDPFRTNDYDLESDDIYSEWLKFGVLSLSFHFLLNKLIRKDLLGKILNEASSYYAPYRNVVHLNHSLVFVALLFRNSVRIANVRNHFAIYDGDNYQKFVFQYIKKFPYLHVYRYARSAINYIKTWPLSAPSQSNLFETFRKRLLKRLVRAYNQTYADTQTRFFKQVIADRFALREKELNEEAFEYGFDEVTTPLYPLYAEYENIICAITDDKTEYVFFDVFDTLLFRPFWTPSDLFHFIGKEYSSRNDSDIFTDIGLARATANRNIGAWLKLNRPSEHSKNIHDIYEYVAEAYAIEHEKAQIAKEAEQKAEIRYCYRRKSAFELYNFALDCGKKCVAVSDMYLDSNTILEMLNKCGYGNPKLYVSNETGKTKRGKGELFQFIKHDLGIESLDRCVLIDDNFENSIEPARKNNIRAFHFPRAATQFSGSKLFDSVFKKNKSILLDPSKLLDTLGMRILAAIAANELYDFPYIQNNDSVIANDVRQVGTFLLGISVFSVSKWLIESVRDKQYRKILFTTRDGYLVKYGYDILSKYFDGLTTKSELFFQSRATTVPISIQTSPNIDLIPLIQSATSSTGSPRNLIDWFVQNSFLSKDIHEKCREILGSEGIDYDKKFSSQTEDGPSAVTHLFYKTIGIIKKHHLIDYDDFEQKLNEIRKILKKTIGGDDNVAIFDCGYSGRMGHICKSLLNYSIDHYYVQRFYNIDAKHSEYSGFRIYPFSPYSRNVSVWKHYYETFFSDYTKPTVRGYNFEKRDVWFSSAPADITSYQKQIMQSSLYDFFQLVTEIFGKEIDSFAFDYCYHEGLLPLTTYFNSLTADDQKITLCLR
jgi:FMN phosphatase YigB (HAD superfamily)